MLWTYPLRSGSGTRARPMVFPSSEWGVVLGPGLWSSPLRSGEWAKTDPLARTHFATIPNVIPSEIFRDADFPDFYEATLTKMEEPFDGLLDRLEPPRPSVIIHDT
ncbi:hypothetical protein HYC85_031625 [Camellia sinensis]|uniref:Uncharacterized protein n=1 Tax=Camellia sinensis TaxID=4442 RepID=A0A7J7FR65_CAMSI|nr:hypothetical protein HYC85_031625 [Camellia sinensis]